MTPYQLANTSQVSSNSDHNHHVIRLDVNHQPSAHTSTEHNHSTINGPKSNRLEKTRSVGKFDGIGREIFITNRSVRNQTGDDIVEKYDNSKVKFDHLTTNQVSYQSIDKKAVDPFKANINQNHTTTNQMRRSGERLLELCDSCKPVLTSDDDSGEYLDVDDEDLSTEPVSN